MKKAWLILLFLSFQGFGQSSILSKGQWIKIAINKTGIYKIDKDFLDKYAPSFSKVSPDRIKIYTGNTGELPQLNSAKRIKDLKEVPVELKDNNGKWEKEDYIAFYASGPNLVYYKNDRFSHHLNTYSNQNFYFITIGETTQKKIEEITLKEDDAIKFTLPFYDFGETEQNNLLGSGRLWVGDLFKSSYSFSPNLEDYASDYQLQFEVLPLGKATQFLKVYAGPDLIENYDLKGTLYSPNNAIERYKRISNRYPIRVSSQKALKDISLILSSESAGNVGVYFNYWSVSYNRTLKFHEGKQIIYRSLPGSDAAKYLLSSFNTKAAIWQIENPFSVRKATQNTVGNFCLESGESEVIIFNEAALLLPKFVENVTNQNLKKSISPELLVVFPEKFREEAEKLVQLKRENEDLEIAAYSTTEIYNEFSSGRVDPTAIRDYCKYLYDLAPEKFKFLLLLGDATYDYKNNNNSDFVKPELLVPTYQSRESLEPIFSYASDDYFGFLDDYEGDWLEGYSDNNEWVSNRENDHFMNIAVGRIPARSTLELYNYIQKYLLYKKTIHTSDWQNKVAFVADNRDFNLHQRDAEELEKIALETFPGLLTDKLMLDDYPIIKEANNDTSPEANQKLHDLINQGTYLITYIGHGAEDGFTNEKLLTLKDILEFKNPTKLPIWLTATCQFGKFDNPAIVSGAELLLLRPNGGAIALLTTTRPVYSSSNQLVNHALFKNLTNANTIGELFKLTKNNSLQGEINRNFSLLGDPTLTLPHFEEQTEMTFSNDTLNALKKVTFIGNTPTITNGTVKITIIDKPVPKKTLGSYNDSPAFAYNLSSEVLFTGVYPVKNNIFEGEIILPKSQQPGIGLGRVLTTFSTIDGSTLDFSYQTPVVISSIVSENEQDNSPPVLTASLVDQNLIWKLKDESGINISNFDTNTAIKLKVNEITIKNINQYYSNIKEGKNGELIYPIASLPNGNYISTLTASDIYNNTSTSTFQFRLDKPKLQILKAKTFPNPVANYFNISILHNKMGEDLSLELILIDELGRVLWKEKTECVSCDETFNYTTHLNIENNSFPKVYYSIILQTTTEKEKATLNGSLFFWK